MYEQEVTDRSQAPGIQIYYEREEGIIFILILVNRVSRILSLSLPLYGECLTGIVMTELTHGKVNDVIFLGSHKSGMDIIFLGRGSIEHVNACTS